MGQKILISPKFRVSVCLLCVSWGGINTHGGLRWYVWVNVTMWRVLVCWSVYRSECWCEFVCIGVLNIVLVSVLVCKFVCLFACARVYVFSGLRASVFVCRSVWLSARGYVCAFACLCACMWVIGAFLCNFYACCLFVCVLICELLDVAKQVIWNAIPQPLSQQGNVF